MNLSADSTRAEERQNLSLVLLQQMYQPLTGESTGLHTMGHKTPVMIALI